MTAVNMPDPQQVQFPVNKQVNCSPLLKSLGLEKLVPEKVTKEKNPQLVVIIQDSNATYYSKDQILKVAGEVLGTLSSKYQNDQSKIEACLNMIFKFGESISKVKENYESFQAVTKAQKKWSEAETNRMTSERMLPNWNKIKKELDTRAVKLDATSYKNAADITERITKYREELQTTLPANVRSETLKNYQKDLSNLCTILKFPSTKERDIPKFLEFGKSIGVFLTQEIQGFDKYTKLNEERNPITDSAITRQFQLNEAIEKADEEISKLLEAESKEQPELSILKAYNALTDRAGKIKSLSLAHAISPTDAKVLQCQSQFALSRIKAAVAQLNLNKNLEPVKENLLKGVVKSKSWGMSRNPEEVKAEVRGVIGTLLAQGIILEQQNAWEAANKILNALKTVEKEEYFPQNNDPMRTAWENESARRAKLTNK